MIKENLRAQILGGCLRDAKDHMSGNYKGYYLTVCTNNTQYFVMLNAHSANDEGNGMLAAFLQKQKESNKNLVEYKTYAHAVLLTIKSPNLAKNVPEAINSVVEPIVDYLINGMYESGCDCCGSTSETVNCYEINGGFHYICENCVSQVQADLQQTQSAIKAQKSNLIPGIVGAMLGALIGCALWMLIYKLGYIAGIAGAVTGICAMKGYEMFGKHLDKKGVIASVIVMFVMIFFANKLSWSWEIYDVYKVDGVTFFEAFQAADEVIAYSDLTSSYYMDLVIGYVLTLLATYKNIINAFKASTGSYTMKKEN